MSITAIITFILIFGVIVTAHEFGHFIIAKKSGVLVREFSIGMGPKILYWHKNHTTYTIRILPVGGYVRMAGLDEESDLDAGQNVCLQFNDQKQITIIDKRIENTSGVIFQIDTFDLQNELFLTGFNKESTEKQVYDIHHDAIIVEKDGTEVQIAPKDTWVQNAPVYKRAMINVAGPLMNFILTFFIFSILGFIQPNVNLNENVIGSVQSGMPAADAGIKVNDKIIKIDNDKTNTWEEITENISNKSNQEITLSVERLGHLKQITLKPQLKRINGKEQSLIGITNRTYTDPVSRLKYGFISTITAIQKIWHALTHLFTGGFSLDKLGGPVAIAKTTSEVSKTGFLNILFFTAMLSANLGIMNLIPIPALDGGKLVLNAIEAILRKPLPTSFENGVTIAGAAVMLVLMVAVTINDLLR